MATILCLHDHPTISGILVDSLRCAGHDTVVVRTATEAQQVLANDLAGSPVIIVACDSSLEGLRRLASADEPRPGDGGVMLTTLNIDQAERQLIVRALEVSKGNRTRAAGLLGMSVRTLRNKLNGRKVGAAVE